MIGDKTKNTSLGQAKRGPLTGAANDGGWKRVFRMCQLDNSRLDDRHAHWAVVHYNILRKAFVAFLFLHWVSACLGVTLGYHRLLTHGSFVVPRALQYFFSICGMISTEESAGALAVHLAPRAVRPRRGPAFTHPMEFWWLHYALVPAQGNPGRGTRLVPPLGARYLQRPGSSVFPQDRFILYPILLGGWQLPWFGRVDDRQRFVVLALGLFMRMVVLLPLYVVRQAEATHIWGYRNYESSDRSRNLWWVASVNFSYGEGWHNNHHAHQLLAEDTATGDQKLNRLMRSFGC